jgi:hypothetical protein
LKKISFLTLKAIELQTGLQAEIVFWFIDQKGDAQNNRNVSEFPSPSL